MCLELILVFPLSVDPMTTVRVGQHDPAASARTFGYLISVRMAPTIINERILVTGATGYIGSFLVPRLAEHNEVHVLARDKSAAISALGLASDRVHSALGTAPDVLRAFETIQPTLVFHLATHYEKHDDIHKLATMVDANVGFGSFVLSAASTLKQCEVVLAGSHFQFGSQPGKSASFYAATKNALCDIARYLQDARGLLWIQPVLFDVYGPEDPRQKLIAVVVNRVLAGELVALPDPEPLHHFVYIDDVVDALIASAIELRADHSRSGTNVFVTSDQLATPSLVVAEVAAATHTDAKLDPVAYMLPEGSIMTPVAGSRPRGWQPQVGLRQGIGRIVARASQHPGAVR